MTIIFHIVYSLEFSEKLHFENRIFIRHQTEASSPDQLGPLERADLNLLIHCCF
jgi:hypothetical protein